MSIKEQHVAQRLSVNAQLVSSMKLYPQSVCQLAFLTLCCALITICAVRESASTFVPGRCLCPRTQNRVRGKIKELIVYPKSARCDKVTIIVTLRTDNRTVCMNPETPMGKRIIRCWKRIQMPGRNVMLCLKRWKKWPGGQRQRQRGQGQSRKASSSKNQPA